MLYISIYITPTIRYFITIFPKPSISTLHVCILSVRLKAHKHPSPNMILSERSSLKTASIYLAEESPQHLCKVLPSRCRPVFSAPLSPATTLMIERRACHSTGELHLPSTHKRCRTNLAYSTSLSFQQQNAHIL